MHLPYFSASSRVWESAEWVSHIEECGYGGWEVVADGQYRLDDPTHLSEVMEVLASTGLTATVPCAWTFTVSEYCGGGSLVTTSDTGADRVFPPAVARMATG